METLSHLAGHSKEGQVPDMVKLGFGDSLFHLVYHASLASDSVFSCLRDGYYQNLGLLALFVISSVKERRLL